MEYESGNSILAPAVCQLLNYDNMVIELVCDGSIFFPYITLTFFYELCRLGVLALSKQGQMSAQCNFNLILLAPLQSALQITKFTAMIFGTYELLIVH